MTVNLKEKPFYLEQEGINWVHDTIEKMSLEEKIGQLFIHLGQSTEEEYIKNMAEKCGFRFRDFLIRRKEGR